VQFHLHLQLKEAADYASKNGVVLKGDIPIGVYRYGCDAWMAPELYHMDQQAGAPPDDFAVKGQNWGFPTYNWQKMQEDDFSWWQQRFQQMSNYFAAFRIDHILGFFRIWSIPMHAVEGGLGHFVPAIPVNIIEFSQKNIWFDYQRYCQPFITDEILSEIFGQLNEKVKSTFLIANDHDSYDLEMQFATQRQVARYFETVEPSDENAIIQQGLFDLISNVIFLEEENSQGTLFHFRIAMDNTSSFRYLDAGLKRQLKDLYINYFYQRQDDFWKKEAMHKLPYLKATTNMLICGEDLGMVPHPVPEVMKQLGILSLEIQRMPKDMRKEFFHPNDAPYLSVITPSTHDMSTIRGWWEEDRNKTQRFFNNELGQPGAAPFFCEAWINRAIILQHLYSPAMWSIFQLQDLLGMDETLRRNDPHEERINIPADPKHYWRYRMHITLEQLIKEKTFNLELQEYISNSGR
jgi:4-alpha-glucanotransferase